MRSLQHLPAVRVHMRGTVVLSEEAERGVAFGQLDAQPRASAGAFVVLASNSQIQADEAPRRWPGCRAGLPVVAAASRLRPTTLACSTSPGRIWRGLVMKSLASLE